MQNLYHIKNKLGQKQLFTFNNTQKVLHKAKTLWNATLKGRQQGVSTYYLIRYLDDCLFQKNINAAIIAHTRESIEKLFRVVMYAYKYMDDSLKPMVARGGGSKYEFYFPANESRIYVSLEVRSDAVQKLHVSEYGLMKNKDKYDASIEAVPLETGEASIESTPFGLNHFYKDWIDTDWKYQKHFFPWYFHYENTLSVSSNESIIPTEEEIVLIEKADKAHQITITKGQLKWRREKIKQKSFNSFIAEHPEDDQTCFLTSGLNVLDTQRIKNQLLSIHGQKERKGVVVIYEPHNKDDIYVCGADPAGGTGGDYSVASIFRVRGWVQCAQIRSNKWRPKVFAEHITEMCEIYQHGYNWPLLGVERNNHGHAVLLVLSELTHYPNLFFHEDYDEKLGWHTTSLTRPTLLDHFVEAVESDVLKIKSKELLGECLTLVDNNGKIEAQEGEHDDCIISAAISIQLLQKSKKLELWDNLGSLIKVD